MSVDFISVHACLMPKNVWEWLSVSRLQWKAMASCSLLAADKTPYWVIRNFL